jgi:hypothetical protein
MIEGGETHPMNKTVTLVLALAAGLIGGLLSRNITLSSVHAQTQTDPVELRARSFTLVSDQGRVMGTFTAREVFPNVKIQGDKILPARVVLIDPMGHEIWSASGDPFKKLSQNSK